MTFAEILVLLFVAVFIFKSLRPLERRLYDRLVKFFRRREKNGPRPVIDITDYKK